MESVPKPTTKQKALGQGSSYRQALQQMLLREHFLKDGYSISLNLDWDFYWRNRGVSKAELCRALENWEGPGRIEFVGTPCGVKAVWRAQ